MILNRRTFVATAAASALLTPRRAAAMQTPLGAPIRLQDRRVLMECAFADGQRWPFVIDTGGAYGLIRTDLARSLGLRRLGAQRLRLRVGNRPYDIYEARDFLLGGVIRQQAITFAAVDDIFPPEQAGSLPAGILTEMPSELAMRRGQWRIWPDGGPDRDGWTVYTDAIREAAVASGSPLLYADVAVGGATIRVGLDTGMPVNNYLYGAAATRAGLTTSARWAPAPPDGNGRVVRAAIGMAGIVTSDALVTVVDGPEWSEFPNGIMGLGLLQRYDIATDPATRTTYLRPNGQAAAPLQYNRFGAWIDRRGEEIVLRTVAPGSPAEQAGLRSGDRITGIRFEDMLSQIYQPAGSSLSFSVRSNGGMRAMTVMLTDYL
jgi:hypothetical protein